MLQRLKYKSQTLTVWKVADTSHSVKQTVYVSTKLTQARAAAGWSINSLKRGAPNIPHLPHWCLSGVKTVTAAVHWIRLSLSHESWAIVKYFLYILHQLIEIKPWLWERRMGECSLSLYSRGCLNLSPLWLKMWRLELKAAHFGGHVTAHPASKLYTVSQQENNIHWSLAQTAKNNPSLHFLTFRQPLAVE